MRLEHLRLPGNAHAPANARHFDQASLVIRNNYRAGSSGIVLVYQNKGIASCEWWSLSRIAHFGTPPKHNGDIGNVLTNPWDKVLTDAAD